MSGYYAPEAQRCHSSTTDRLLVSSPDLGSIFEKVRATMSSLQRSSPQWFSNSLGMKLQALGEGKYSSREYQRRVLPLVHCRVMEHR